MLATSPCSSYVQSMKDCLQYDSSNIHREISDPTIEINIPVPDNMFG